MLVLLLGIGAKVPSAAAQDELLREETLHLRETWRAPSKKAFGGKRYLGNIGSLWILETINLVETQKPASIAAQSL